MFKRELSEKDHVKVTRHDIHATFQRTEIKVASGNKNK